MPIPIPQVISRFIACYWLIPVAVDWWENLGNPIDLFWWLRK